MKSALSLSAVALAVATTASATAAPEPEWDPLPFKRDVATISSVIQSVSTALQGLDDSINSFTGQDFSQLANSATNVQTVISQGTSQIQGTAPITAQEAITLQSSLSPVQQLGTKLSTDLVAKKPQIQQANLCSVVQQQSGDIGTAANGLISTTVSKVPSDLQSVAGSLTSGFTSQLSDLSLQFAPGNCTNASGGGAGSNSTALPGTTSTTSKSAGSMVVVSSGFGMVVALAAAGRML